MKTAPNEGSVYHYGLIRARIAGSANVRFRLLSLDEVKTTTLAPLTIADPTSIEYTKLANFTQQRAQLEIKTTGFGETFHCSKFVVFIKPVATSYPG